MRVNNEKLSQDISCLVKQRLAGELELLLQESGQKEEERFRLLDETIRSFQKAGQEEAAATKVPFLIKENALDGGLRNFFTGKREVKENKKNNKNKEKEGQARERCYGSCFWFVLFCDFLKTVKNIEK